MQSTLHDWHMKSSSQKLFELKLRDGTAARATDYGDFILLRNMLDSHTSLAAFGRSIFEQKLSFVDEVIATEVEICLKLNCDFDTDCQNVLEQVEISVDDTSSTDIELPIRFTDHEDWTRIGEFTGISRAEYQKRLLGCSFTVAMNGFLPGFVYLNGLPKELQVPRKATPTTRTSSNAFAIGGKYAGIYSLPSPAGWNVVGLVADQLFDQNLLPPIKVRAGDSVKLVQVDEVGFERRKISTSATVQKSVSVNRENIGKLSIEKPGLLTVLQDQGRTRFAYFSIPVGGSMDRTAAALANTILGNGSNTPVIECHFVPPTIRFDSEATICLTGADMNWRLNGRKVGRNRTVEVAAGGTLSGSAATNQCRAYIAIRGEIETDRSFGSASCYLPGRFGGNNGKPLTIGDEINWVKPSAPLFPLRIDLKENGDADTPFDVLRGPEFDWLDNRSQEALRSASFSISAESDRMGARLNGPNLSTGGKMLSDSVPLLPGMIQLTPAGQCIVVLQDGQTTGGYPRIGYLSAKTVERLNQTPVGRSFHFEIA